MQLIGKEPSEFISGYFEELRNIVDQKAEEAKQKIINDHIKLINSLKAYEEAAINEADRPNKAQSAAIEKLVAKFTAEKEHWEESFNDNKEVHSIFLIKIFKV